MSATFLGLPSFPEAAAASTQDEQLRRNLTHATHGIRAKRGRVVGEKPDFEELRHAGAAIKNKVLRHLDTYLLEVEQKVTAAGGTVHWAMDADEAKRIVTDLVKATAEKEVVKVK